MSSMSLKLMTCANTLVYEIFHKHRLVPLSVEPCTSDAVKITYIGSDLFKNRSLEIIALSDFMCEIKVVDEDTGVIVLAITTRNMDFATACSLIGGYTGD